MTPLQNIAIVAICLVVTIVPAVAILVLRDFVRSDFRRRQKAKEEQRGFEVRLPPD